ncbi:protein-disulfide reductase DsbD domain-containing protein [Verrucomicrobiales bacterium BCK34]|nr:protein-disulfide reductase DsbD domain-containing protein [Verrucomicrobiales bacterium BCK34]
MKLIQSPVLFLTLLFFCKGMAEDSAILKPEGFKSIELVSAVKSVTPGKTFQVGLLFTLAPEYHTYWRGPGVVGVAPSFEWDLPEGFEIGKTYWPAPEIVDMAGIKANGYHGEALIITELTPPASLETKEVSLKVRSAWMACASSCQPGVGDFSITLPVQSADALTQPNPTLAGKFRQTLEAIPPSSPDDWEWKATREDSTISLKLKLPDSGETRGFEEIHFFSDDMQVDSDEPQSTSVPQAGGFDLVQKLPVPDFAPENPKQLSGLLFNAKGWPGLNSKFVEVNIPWTLPPPEHE